jgi:hypothetical protein
MKFIKGTKKTVNDWAFIPTSCEKSAVLKNSNVNIEAQVSPAPYTPRLAHFTVIIKNKSEYDLQNFYAMANVTDGISLTNLGEMFGTSWRMEKIQSLRKGQIIRFKLALRSNVNSINGSLNLIISPTTNVDDQDGIKLSLTLHSSPLN